MLTILASECITYDASYILVLVASSPCLQPWTLSLALRIKFLALRLF